jgi:choline dehydrogenase-like flavoprotein
MPDSRYDVIIIGSGAGGGTLAWKLAPSGKRILLLERGGYLPREKDNWRSRAVFVDNKYKAAETWTDKHGKTFAPGIHYYVGGNTKVYGAVLLRMRERDFEAVRHKDGLSPEWPLKYADFAPYYTEAERLYSVHGLRGADPTEPPCDAPYPHPPLSHEPRIQQLHDDLERIGRTPFPLPVGIKLVEDDRPASPCIRCDTCDGFPCLVDAKADAHIACVRPALEHPNVTLMTDSLVERLETSPSGREVTGVVVRRGAATETYKGDIVVVACGAINSAALLLRSANDAHPNGLANGSDVVGRHYMCHNNSAMLALSTTPNPTQFQKTLGLNDYYFGAEDCDYPLGHLQMLGKTRPEMFVGETHGLVPNMALEKLALHSLDFWATTEDLPLPENRVTLHNGSIRLSYTDTNVEAHNRLLDKLKALLRATRCEPTLIPRETYLGKRIPIAGTAHQCGTVRFGPDPATSVLDLDCKAHEVDNLYVVDSSFFVSSSSVNPTLTIIANALRVGERLTERWG